MKSLQANLNIVRTLKYDISDKKISRISSEMILPINVNEERMLFDVNVT